MKIVKYNRNNTIMHVCGEVQYRQERTVVFPTAARLDNAHVRIYIYNT